MLVFESETQRFHCIIIQLREIKDKYNFVVRAIHLRPEVILHCQLLPTTTITRYFQNPGVRCAFLGQRITGVALELAANTELR